MGKLNIHYIDLKHLSGGASGDVLYSSPSSETYQLRPIELLWACVFKQRIKSEQRQAVTSLTRSDTKMDSTTLQ